jgi:hypothetical protein
MAKQRAPTGLGLAGKALWREVHSVYELDVVERGRLFRVCQLVDLRQRLLDEGHGIQSAQEVRRLAVEIDKLLAALGVAGGGAEQPNRTLAAQAMAGRRWSLEQVRESGTRRQHG